MSEVQTNPYEVKARLKKARAYASVLAAYPPSLIQKMTDEYWSQLAEAVHLNPPSLKTARKVVAVMYGRLIVQNRNRDSKGRFVKCLQ